jgi:hypothetical protein
MSERDEPYHPAGGWSAHQSTVRPDPDAWREQTTPGITPVQGGPAPGPGATAAHPAAGRVGYPGGTAPAVTTPEYSSRPVAYRRPDTLAALLLLLAGIAAGVSLLLPWVRGSNATGWDLMRIGWNQVQTGAGTVFRTGMWQPAAVVLGGAVLFVLGLLLFVPARTHRFLGALALLAALAAAAGVLVALSGADWRVRRFDIGFWFGAAVAVLGVLGAFKALVTGPRFGTRRPRV